MHQQEWHADNVLPSVDLQITAVYGESDDEDGAARYTAAAAEERGERRAIASTCYQDWPSPANIRHLCHVYVRV